MTQAIKTILNDLPPNEAWWVGTDSEKYIVPVHEVLEALEQNALMVCPRVIPFDSIDGELVKISGNNDIKSGNTYNSGSNLSNDFCYYTADGEDGYYIAIAIHRGGDVRCNYTDFVVFKFDSFEACWETIEEVGGEHSVDLDIDGTLYTITPNVIGEYYYVYGDDLNTELYPDDITDEEMEKAIREALGE